MSCGRCGDGVSGGRYSDGVSCGRCGDGVSGGTTGRCGDGVSESRCVDGVVVEVGVVMGW